MMGGGVPVRLWMPGEASDVFLRHALSELRSRHDPLIDISAAVAVLRIENGELERDDLADLLELAEEYAEDLEGIV